MVSKGQCPHFETHQGVCGCPEFWILKQRSQNDRRPPVLQEVPDARYDRSTSGVQYNTGANLIPLPDRTKTKTQSATPAPSDLPKETCFFWYHGACRRGDDCDRFHETDPTWPISPPPGFRHYQPCILPLCPLRTDQESTKKPQVYQRRDRTMGGQADGAAFSRATTAGESPSVSDSTNTDTDMSEASEKLSTISLDAIVARDVQDGVVTQTPAEDTCKEGVIPDGEVKARQDLGSNEFDQSDYIDLSQLLSPPSTPIVQEETLLSISHPGTLRKRCPLRATESSYSSHKRIKLAESTPLDLSNFVSILERPRDMSQWDVRLPGYSLSHLTHMHSFPPQPSPVVAVNTEPTTFKLQPFDPPKGPRSSGTEPPICFFYYHKGYCKPKRGRRCDYLHNTNTPQQTVSLPLGIDNHDPTCSLPLCPVRIQSLGQLGQESKHFPANTQSLIEHEGTTHRRLSNSLAHGRPSPSPRGITTDVQRRHPRGMLDLALLKLPGVLRQRRKEQTRKIEQIQMDQGISFNIDAEARARAKKRMRRKQRRSQKQAGEDVTESLRPQMQEEDSNRQVLNNQPNTSTTQRRLLPSLAVEEEASTSAFLSPAGVEGLLQIQPPGELWPRGSIQSERIWGIKPEIAYKSHPSSTVQGFSSSLETSDVLPAPLQQVLSNGNLDMERRAQINGKRAARHRVYDLEQQSRLEQVETAPGIAHLLTSAASLSPRHVVRGDDVGFISGPRFQRYRRNQNGYDCQQPSQHCTDARIGAGGNIDWDEGSGDNEPRIDTAAAIGNTADKEMPEGEQRLDWDTDLVRRLFGEIA